MKKSIDTSIWIITTKKKTYYYVNRIVRGNRYTDSFDTLDKARMYRDSLNTYAKVCIKCKTQISQGFYCVSCLDNGYELAVYEQFKGKLKADDIRNKNGYLEVSCYKCKRLYTPTAAEAGSRLQSIKTNNGKQCNFYCSDKCKQTCSVFAQKKRSKLEYRAFQDLKLLARGNQRKSKICIVSNMSTPHCERRELVTNKLELHHTIAVAKTLNATTNTQKAIANIQNPDSRVVLCYECHKQIPEYC